jgi:hypothetical protein
MRLNLVATALLVGAAACSGDKPPPKAVEIAAAPQPTSSAAAEATAPVEAAPPKPLDPHGTAYVIDGTGLVEIDATGAHVLADAERWCNVDARAQVVWFVDFRGLKAFDLTDRTVHTVIAQSLNAYEKTGTDIGSLEPIIDWGKNEKLGGEDAVSFDVGVAVHMTSKPRLEMVMGCEGDRAVYCFDEHQQPSKSVVALKALVKELPLDTAYVSTLASRGSTRSLRSPPPVPTAPPAPPVFDHKTCADYVGDNRCGELTAIPGSPLWLVLTANSRGDYYDESRELWDPATREFLRIEGSTLTRAKDPVGEGTFDGLLSSPNGLLSMHGIVLDANHVFYTPKGGGRTCGFAGGGWRVRGPRG